MRIRTIKPEFWESETLSKVSRDARLLFIGLFNCCDDSGRSRASSRILASRIFPYDDDALAKIPVWLAELEKAGCVVQYSVDNSSYLFIPKWLDHQKIDKPSKSKMPPPPGIPRDTSENPREDSRNIALEQGTGNREGNGCDSRAVELPPGFPDTEEKAVEWASMSGVPKDVAVKAWLNAMARGGVDAKGIPIRDWRRYAQLQLSYDRANPRANGGQSADRTEMILRGQLRPVVKPYDDQ